MSVSDNRISAIHPVARKMLHTRAHLGGWVEARQRGISPKDCDAIADAALDAALDLLARWEADRPSWWRRILKRGSAA